METRTKALMASKPQDENIVKQRANQGRKVFRKKSNTKGKAARLFPWDGEESNCLEVLNLLHLQHAVTCERASRFQRHVFFHCNISSQKNKISHFFVCFEGTSWSVLHQIMDHFKVLSEFVLPLATKLRSSTMLG